MAIYRFALVLTLASASGTTLAQCPSPVPSISASNPISIQPSCARPKSGVPYLGYAVSQIQGRINNYLQVSHVPGLSIAVVRGGKVVYSQGFGVANMDTGARVDADTVFQLASISKPIGATVISTQVSAKKVTWDTSIASSLPWFALGTSSSGSSSDWVSQNVSLADMYSHRSGLPDHAGDDLEGLGYDRKTILQQLRYLPLEPFRASYAYTNYGIMAAAEAVAQKVGAPWAQLSNAALYQPLGMTRTTSDFTTYIAYPNHAVGHSPIDDNLDGAWRVTPEQYDGDRAAAGGGVSSSANDMAKWMVMLLAGGKAADGTQLIDPVVLRDIMSAHNILPLPGDATLASSNAFYGYAFNTGQTSDGMKLASHNGALGQGASTNFEIVPALDLGVVVLTNGFPLGLPETVTSDFLELAQFGEVRTDAWDFYQTAFRNAIKAAFASSSVSADAPPANAKPAQPLANYAGTYHNDYFGDAVVTVVNSALQLHMGPTDGGMTWTLTHWDGDVFKLWQGTEDASQTTVSAITFNFSGTKATLTDEYYQRTSRVGTLTRIQ
jgi:CubicO group peptidase (beta-lactamase class C family)